MEVEKKRVEMELKQLEMKGKLDGSLNAKKLELEKQQMELNTQMEAKQLEIDGMEGPEKPKFGWGWGGGGEGEGGGRDSLNDALLKAQNFALDTKAPKQADYIDGAKTVLRQVYMRQNCFMNLAQFCDLKDKNTFIIPVAIFTGQSGHALILT